MQHIVTSSIAHVGGRDLQILCVVIVHASVENFSRTMELALQHIFLWNNIFKLHITPYFAL